MLNLLCIPLLPPLSLQLWVMGLRAADDVKESVRGAAGSLVRSLRGISLRIMDAQQSPAAGAARVCCVEDWLCYCTWWLAGSCCCRMYTCKHHA
jgi:hypothetical protein